MTDEKFDQINQRRFELITKQVEVGLTPAEEKVLNRLQHLVGWYTRELYPLPWRELMVMEYETKKLRKENKALSESCKAWPLGL